MAGSINKVILVGNLGRDPEMRATQDGSKMATFSVATSETWKDRMSGERKETSGTARVVVFNKNLADVCENFGLKSLHRGSTPNPQVDRSIGSRKIYNGSCPFSIPRRTCPFGQQGRALAGNDNYAIEDQGGYADPFGGAPQNVAEVLVG